MDIVMPQLGETVKEGTVTVWRKKVGERVEKDEPLFEVATDKVDTDVPSPASGVLSAIFVPEGKMVQVGEKLATITEERALPATGGGRRPEHPTEERALPATGGGRRPEHPTEEEQVVVTPLDVRPLGVPLPGPRLSAPAMPLAPRESAAGEGRLSPVVRKLLSEHGLDPAAIRGTGAGGRITRDDVLAHVAEREKAGQQPNAPLSSAREASPERQVVSFSRIRKVTAERMALSWRTIPHVLQAIEVDFQAVEEARLAAGEAWKAKEGFGLTILPFVAHAVCAAIREFPAVNASVVGCSGEAGSSGGNSSREESGPEAIALHRRVHLGIAVDLGAEGLIVPVVKDAADRSLPDLARAMRAVSEKARSKRLSADDVAGATYTISNSGKFGTLLTAPIIDPPQVAILSLDGVARKPAAVGDTIALRPIGVLAQSFDHRAFDGAYGAAFLRRVKEILEGRNWSADL